MAWRLTDEELDEAYLSEYNIPFEKGTGVTPSAAQAAHQKAIRVATDTALVKLLDELDPFIFRAVNEGSWESVDALTDKIAGMRQELSGEQQANS